MYKVDDSHCIGCGVCVDVCPEGAINLTDEDVAKIDQEMCIGWMDSKNGNLHL